MEKIFISAVEASKFLALSSTTLERFIEAGYLKTTNQNGEIGFWTNDLEQTFGVTVKIIETNDYPTEQKVETVSPPEIIAPEELSTISKEEINEDNLLEDTEVEIEESTSVEVPEIDPVKTAPASSPTPTVEFNSPANDLKWQRILDLQEQLLQAKDRELIDLRKQRDWLEERIEKMEAKAERDQLLLLSETRTITKLIEITQKKKSGLQLALEWIGVKPKESNGNAVTVEVENKSQN